MTHCWTRSDKVRHLCPQGCQFHLGSCKCTLLGGLHRGYCSCWPGPNQGSLCLQHWRRRDHHICTWYLVHLVQWNAQHCPVSNQTCSWIQDVDLNLLWWVSYSSLHISQHLGDKQYINYVSSICYVLFIVPTACQLGRIGNKKKGVAVLQFLIYAARYMCVHFPSMWHWCTAGSAGLRTPYIHCPSLHIATTSPLFLWFQEVVSYKLPCKTIVCTDMWNVIILRSCHLTVCITMQLQRPMSGYMVPIVLENFNSGTWFCN